MRSNLEDLDSVKGKLLSTLFCKTVDEEFVQDPDMTGPLLLGFILGLTLVLVGLTRIASSHLVTF